MAVDLKHHCFQTPTQRRLRRTPMIWSLPTSLTLFSSSCILRSKHMSTRLWILTQYLFSSSSVSTSCFLAEYMAMEPGYFPASLAANCGHATRCGPWDVSHALKKGGLTPSFPFPFSAGWNVESDRWGSHVDHYTEAACGGWQHKMYIAQSLMTVKRPYQPWTAYLDFVDKKLLYCLNHHCTGFPAPWSSFV